MAVTINKTDGTVLTSIADGAIDLSSSNLALIGRLYRNYGELINENLVKLLENFANSGSPSTPLVGQLWYDTSDKKIKVYRSTGFVPLAVSTNSTTEPSSPTLGDFWYDTVDAQLKTWTGAAWTVIAPAYTAAQGKTGAFAENIIDTLSNNHITVFVYQSGQIIAAFSNDNEYIPRSSITGFTSIKKGVTLSNATGIKMHGTATSAELLNGFDGTEFIRSDASDTSTGTLTIENAQPLILGSNNELEINITSTNADFVKVNSGAIRFFTDNTELVMQLNDNKQVVVDQGTSTSPGIAFNGDTDTGIYSPAANTLTLTAGGTGRLSVTSVGATINGTFTSSSGFDGDITSVNGNIGTLTTTTITPTFIAGTPTFTNNVTFGADLFVNGSTILGNTGSDNIVFNAASLTIFNGLSIAGGSIVHNGDFTMAGNFTASGNITSTLGGISAVGNVVTSGGGISAPGDIVSTAGSIVVAQDVTAGADATIGNNLTVANELIVQSDSGSGVSSFRVDGSGRLLVNVNGPAVSASNTGDATFGDSAHVYAANTAKWWAAWKDNTNSEQFAFLGEHLVDSITRESGAGEYKINLDYNMTTGSYYSVVGMGAYGNMNMLEFPLGGAYVRVKNELYDYTGTRDSSYNSVVAFGV